MWSFKAVCASTLLLAVLAPSPAQPAPAPVPSQDDVLFIVCFSGGGTRAAAFGYGVVRALQGISTGEHSLMDRVDRFGGASGGSFVAAQAVADPSPEGWARFRREILATDLETELLKTALTQSLQLARTADNRSNVAARYYDRFHRGKTLADLEAAGPELWIQTTILSTGEPLALRRTSLAHLGLPSEEMTVGTALAASAAVPGGFPPLNLTIPGHLPSQCRERHDSPASSTSRRRISLADGGISDNLAVQALLQGSLPEGTRRVVVVVADSRRRVPQPWNLADSSLMSAGYTVAIQQRIIDELWLDRVRDRLTVLRLEAEARDEALETELAVIDFDGSPHRDELDGIGTRLSLGSDEVELLVDEGRAQARAKLEPLAEHWLP